MNSRYILHSLLLLVAFSANASAQAVNNHKYKVLFLGNSYTYVNDLPLVLSNAAKSVGDTVIYSSNSIGGYTLQMHTQNATSLSYITAGGLDYAVLQEQSQWPSFPDDQVDTGMFPYAKRLDSLVHVYNTCGRSMFYMTWGRKNGDADNCPFWPPVCTYNGMDSLLRLRYMMMADSNDAVVSPVGAVWRYIRNNYPSISLYQADESHPDLAGTYAAACCFYVAIFKRNPELITYNYSLSATDAANIRTAAKRVVYDSMSKWHIGQYDVNAQFTYTVTGNSVSFANNSANATDYTWLFGDAQSSTIASPVHNYGARGVYTVKLVAINCGKSDTITVSVDLNPVGVSDVDMQGGIVLMPNPVHDVLCIRTAITASHLSHIIICNSVGQIVYSGAEQAINTSAFSKGMYILSAADDAGRVYRRTFIRD